MAIKGWEIGTAFIQIVPSFDKIQGQLKEGAQQIARGLGEATEKSLPDALAKSVQAATKRAEKVAEEGGEKVAKALAASTGDATKQAESAHAAAGKANAQAYADHFEEEFKRRLTAAFKRLPRAVAGQDAPDGELLDMVKLRAEVKRVRDTRFDMGDAGDTMAIAEARRLRDLLRDAEQNTGSRQYRIDLAAGRREIEHFLAVVENRMGAFQRKVTADVNRAATALSTLDAHKLNDRARDEINELRKELLDLGGTRIGLDLDDSTFMQRLDKVRDRLEEVARVGETAELRWNADQALQAVDDAFRATVTSVERARLEAEAKQKKLDEAEAQRQRIRAERLQDQEDAARKRKAAAEELLAKKQAAAEELLAKKKDALEEARLKRQADQEELLRKKQEEFDRRQEQLKKDRADREAAQEAKRLTEKLQRAADEAFGKTFAGKIAKQVDEAFKALPDIGLRPARNAAEQQVKDLRGQLEELRSKRLGVDIDAGEALARIVEIREQLVRLAETDPDVEIHVNSLEAAAKLAEAERMAERLDGKRIALKLEGKDVERLGEMASVSLSRLEALVAGGLSLGTSLVPVAAAAAASIGFIATAAAAATAGVGALALGFSGVGTAVQALNKYQQDSQKSTVALAAAQDRVASATDAVSSANRSLANARASAAAAARRAAEQVADAERTARDARDDAAKAVRDAVERERDAQRDLTRVNVDAREAREALTRAYRDAAKALADLDSQIKSNALDQRQATLDIKEAKEELDKFLTNPRATEEEREQARVTYERRLQQIEDLRRRGKELAEQQSEATRKGIAGSDQVVAARRRVAEADQRVASAQRALERARESVVRAQLDGARQVADAQRRVAEAQRSQSEQQRQSASSIAQAQQSVISAQRQLGQAIEKTSVAGGEALQNLKTAMENLSPAGQKFAKFLFSLKPEFDRLRATAAEGVLPGVQKAFETALPYLPAFTEWMGKVAEAVGNLFAKGAQFLSTNATWQDFFTFMGATAVPALQQMARIGRDVTTGVLGLIMAFQPFNADIGQGLEGLAERFAHWATTLQANPSFQEFLAYVKDNAGAVIDMIRAVATFIGHFVVAAAPIGAVVLRAFTGFVEVLNAIPVPMLTIVLSLVGLLAAAMLAFSSAQRASALVGNTWNRVAERSRDVSFYLGYGLSSLKDQWAANVAAQQQSIGAMQQSRTEMAQAGAQAARMRAEMLALNPAASGTRVAFANVGASLAEMRSQLVSSETSGRVLGTTLGALQTAGGVAKQGLSSLVGFLGGPWGVAITGAILAIGAFTHKQEEHKAKTAELQTALGALSNAYKEFKNGSKDALEAAVAQNAGLQNIILNTSRYGVTVGEIARALDGEEFAKKKVLEAYDREIDAINDVISKKKDGKDVTEDLIRLGIREDENLGDVFYARRDERDAVVAQIEAHGRAKTALDILNRETEKAATKAVPQLAHVHDELSGKLAANERRVAALTVLVDVFGNSQATAAEKADALRRAIELQTGAKIAAIEAEEAEARARRGLTGSVEQNRAALQAQVEAGKLSAAQADKMSRSLSVHTEEGDRNRDALEASARAVRDRYIADIESGMPMAEATKAYQERIAKLEKDTIAMGLDEDQVKDLIAAYGKVDPSVTTVYTQKGFDDVFAELEKLQVAQYALKHGIDPRDAWAEYNRAKAAAKGNYPQGGGRMPPKGDGYGVAPQFFSLGGRVWGEGTSTSDSIFAMLSNREFVQPASSVDYYGEGLMEAIRHRQLPREMFPGFAKGGSVEYPFPVSALMTRIPGMDEIRKAVLAQIGGETKGTGGIGSADMMRLLRVVFPGLDLYSGYRPGSRTPSGNLSYHAQRAADGDKGRAVDLPPKREVFNWIHDNYFSGTRELIWAGDAARNIWNGRYHRYSQSLLANHGVAGQPNAHIHWAYDQGGYLPPGFTTVYNGTGRPEPVFTDGQWTQISALLADRQAIGAGGGETHHWHFKEAALDHGRLAAWANARDARGRPGRPN